MTGLIFSQSAIFHLQQLSSSFFRKNGVRYRISLEDGILTLLQKSAASTETDIRKNYDAFVLELNSRQIQALSDKGVRLRLPTQSAVSWLQKVG
ncbi:MAG: hypothetical protein IPK77_13395 [Cellvibrio sp.]|nr:hypothetical protein [Cellvibrio sp.]